MSVDLDDSQRAAAHVAPDERQFVVAGPGSGKTEVVAALVEYLVLDEELDPVDEILILSFSNAAVHAVARRLASAGGRPVAVRTVDSLAAEVIAELGDAEEGGLDFDARVARAADLLRDEGWGLLDRVRHVVIDEAQDVVGVRAGFVSQLLRGLPDDAGFSVLGDEAQGIYDFQLDPGSVTGSQRLVDVVPALPGVSQRVLTGQYRARSRDAQRAASLRASVVEARPDALESFEAEIVATGSVDEVAQHLVRWSGTTAFLTDDNGEALVVADELWRAGVVTDLRRPIGQRLAAPWIAETLGDAAEPAVDRRWFTSQFEATPALRVDRLWLAAREVGGRRGAALNLQALVRGLRSGRALPPELLAPTDAAVVVSTVHRAKGLEFDNVVLVDFKDRQRTNERPDDVLRRRFVALTRARGRIVRMSGPPVWDVAKDRRTSRWVRRGRQGWETFGFQIGPGDVDLDVPPADGDAQTQVYLAEHVRTGEPVELVLDAGSSTLDVPVYSIMHGGRSVGRTSDSFGHDLVARSGTARTRGRGSLPWPALSGARVDALVSVAGESRAGPVGRHGLWLAPSLVGLLAVTW